MKIRIALASSFDECAWGYADAFARLGFTALIVGPVHLQFDADLDRTDALETPWTAIRYWLVEKFTLRRGCTQQPAT